MESTFFKSLLIHIHCEDGNASLVTEIRRLLLFTMHLCLRMHTLKDEYGLQNAICYRPQQTLQFEEDNKLQNGTKCNGSDRSFLINVNDTIFLCFFQITNKTSL